MKRLQHLHLHARRDDTGKIALAMVMIVLVTALVAATTVTVLAGHTKTRAARAFAVALQAADAAVNDALMLANNQTLATPTGGLAAAYDCAAGGSRTAPAPVMDVVWSWCATPSARPGTAYDIQVTATAGGKVIRKFTATITGTAVGGGADWHDGRVRYQASWQSGFRSGFFGDREVILRGRSTVASYDSRTGQTGTGQARIGTNGTISIDPATRAASTARVADELVFFDTDAYPPADRCISPPAAGAEHLPTACQVARITSHAPRYQVTDDGAVTPNQFIADACTTVLGRWAASSGQPLSDGGCYTSLIFDRDTSLDPGSRLTVYVTGDIAVAPGVVVNTSRAASPTPDAAALTIYSLGRRVTVEGAGGATVTRVAWALWAPEADCGGTIGPVDVYGAMVCARITTQGGWTLHVDDKISSGDGPVDPSAKHIWAVTSYQEISTR